jgi:hypothetical protein
MCVNRLEAVDCIRHVLFRSSAAEPQSLPASAPGQAGACHPARRQMHVWQKYAWFPKMNRCHGIPPCELHPYPIRLLK